MREEWEEHGQPHVPTAFPLVKSPGTQRFWGSVGLWGVSDTVAKANSCHCWESNKVLQMEIVIVLTALQPLHYKRLYQRGARITRIKFTCPYIAQCPGCSFTKWQEAYVVPCYSFSLLQKRQRTLVTVVIMCVLIVIVTTISWRVPTLQARFLPAHERPPSPPDSKDALHFLVAGTEGSTTRPSADRY
jgi:hypothetical protein